MIGLCGHKHKPATTRRHQERVQQPNRLYTIIRPVNRVMHYVNTKQFFFFPNQDNTFKISHRHAHTLGIAEKIKSIRQLRIGGQFGADRLDLMVHAPKDLKIHAERGENRPH